MDIELTDDINFHKTTYSITSLGNPITSLGRSMGYQKKKPERVNNTNDLNDEFMNELMHDDPPEKSFKRLKKRKHEADDLSNHKRRRGHEDADANEDEDADANEDEDADANEDEDADEYGNLKGFVTYSGDENDPSRDHVDRDRDSDEEDVDYTSDSELDPHEKEYCTYLKTLSDDERQRMKSLEDDLVQYNKHDNKPLKYRILTMNAPMNIKSMTMAKLNALAHLDKSSQDYAYEWTTLNYLLKFPWGRQTQLPVTKSDGSEKLGQYLREAAQFLDTVSYGQNKAKSALLLEIGRYLENPDGHGFILGIKGPPGSGKTTLVCNGLAKLLNRPFFRFDLGGAKHSDLLFGCRKVFERSDVGDLAKYFIEGQCIDPVFFFDELDKVSESLYGMELINGLNDLTDRSRNQSILDQYLNCHMDCSKAIKVFAYNSSDQLPLTLKSRIHEIEIESYTTCDKIAMTMNFFIPRSSQKLNFKSTDIILPKNTIQLLIKNYTDQEEGVRKLEEKIDEIILKLNWARLTSKSSDLVNYHCKHINVSSIKYPLTITPKLLNQILS